MQTGIAGRQKRKFFRRLKWVAFLLIVLGSAGYFVPFGSLFPERGSAHVQSVSQSLSSGNGFLDAAPISDSPSTPLNMTDAEIIRQFSETFLYFDAAKCHFTSNQGLNQYGRYHDGFDFNCMPKNTPFEMTITLPLNIIEVAYDPLYGNHIIGRDLSGRFTFIFAHLSEWFVKVGDVSDPTKVMFKTGTTGNSTGVHLHMEILKEGFPAQLDDVVYKRFKTLYKKEESTPPAVLASVLKITPELAREEYLQYVDNKFFPLSWYKIIALSEHEGTSLLGFINEMMLNPITDYYQFHTYYVNRKGLTDKKDRDAQLAKVRVFLYAFTRAHFKIDWTQEKKVDEAEVEFQKLNPADYPPPKKVVPKKK